MEEKLYSDYDWSLYWIYGEYYPIIPIIRSLRRSIEYSEENSENQRYDNHLRSANEVTHYHLKGIDGKIGYIKDFIVDDSNWVIKYIEFDIRSLIRTKRSAISANLVKDIKWSESTVYANASRENLNEDIRHKTKAGHGFLIAGGG